MSIRTEQVASLLQHIIGEIFSRDMEFPDGVMATISRIDVPADLKTANVFVTALPDNRANEVKAVLNKERKYIQKEVAGKMTMKSTPKLKFIIDHQLEKVSKLEELMDL